MVGLELDKTVIFFQVSLWSRRQIQGGVERESDDRISSDG